MKKIVTLLLALGGIAILYLALKTNNLIVAYALKGIAGIIFTALAVKVIIKMYPEQVSEAIQAVSNYLDPK